MTSKPKFYVQHQIVQIGKTPDPAKWESEGCGGHDTAVEADTCMKDCLSASRGEHKPLDLTKPGGLVSMFDSIITQAARAGAKQTHDELVAEGKCAYFRVAKVTSTEEPITSHVCVLQIP